MAKARKIYWTPRRIKALMEASGCKNGVAFAKLIRISPQLLSNWLNGSRKPQPIMELALDFTAAKFGHPNSGL